MKYMQFNLFTFLWFRTAFTLVKVIQAEKTKDPFYIIAHMPTNVKSLDWALSQGANAIENDFQFNDDDGQLTVVEHGNPCDYLCAPTQSNICRQGLKRKCAGPKANNYAATQLQHVAHLSGVVLYIVDSAVAANWGGRLIIAGQAIIPFPNKNLFGYGYEGKMTIGSTKISTHDTFKLQL